MAAPPATQPDKPDKKEVPKEKVVLAGETFELELAIDEKARTRGLGGREKLDADGGMLFVFPTTRYRAFWMKDCLIDIDVAYLDTRGRIVKTWAMKKEPPQGAEEPTWAYERRLRPYPSGEPMRFAIELKAGTIERLKLKAGQVVELDLPRLKALAR